MRQLNGVLVVEAEARGAASPNVRFPDSMRPLCSARMITDMPFAHHDWPRPGGIVLLQRGRWCPAPCLVPSTHLRPVCMPYVLYASQVQLMAWMFGFVLLTHRGLISGCCSHPLPVH